MKNKIKLIRYSSVLILLLTLVTGLNVSEAAPIENKIVADQEIYGAYRNYEDKIGFFNYYGSMIKHPQFERLWKWDDEIIILRKSGNFGAIDYFGNTVVSFKYEFLDNPSDGTVVYGTDISIEGPKYYGLLDTKGKLIVEAQFDTVEKIPGGGIITSINYDYGKKYGVVFKNKVNVKPMYDGIVDANEQFVVTQNTIAGKKKYGFISSNGNRSETIYDSLSLSADGKHVIAGQASDTGASYQLLNAYGAVFADKSFKYISPKGFSDNNENDTYFVAVVESALKAEKTFSLLTTTGELKKYALSSVDYTPILGRYYKVKDQNELYGLVDRYGNMIIAPRFTRIDSYTKDYFVGSTSEGKGVFNSKNEDIIALSTYDLITITEDNYFIAQNGKQINVFNEDGYLQFQFKGESVTGIGNDRFITVHQSSHKDVDGTAKYYYNLVNEKGRERVRRDLYSYMEIIDEDRIALGQDVDGKWSYPSGGVEYIRAPFADLYGVVDYEGEEIMPVIYKNLSNYSKGVLFAQEPDEIYIEAFNRDGKKINDEPIKSFDPFNRGVVTLQPHRKILKSGYLNKEGKFFQLVHEQMADETLIVQSLKMEDPLIRVIESETTLYSKETVENLVNEEIIDGYIGLKMRYGGEIYILKDKQWYLDTFSQ